MQTEIRQALSAACVLAERWLVPLTPAQLVAQRRILAAVNRGDLAATTRAIRAALGDTRRRPIANSVFRSKAERWLARAQEMVTVQGERS